MLKRKSALLVPTTLFSPAKEGYTLWGQYEGQYLLCLLLLLPDYTNYI